MKKFSWIAAALLALGSTANAATGNEWFEAVKKRRDA